MARLNIMSIKDGLKALSATPTGLLTLNGLRGPLLGPSLEGGFQGAGAFFAFPRSSFIDGFYYTMQNASYGYIWQTQPHVPTVTGYLARQFAQVRLDLYDVESDGTLGDVQYDHPAAQTIRWPARRGGHYGGSEWREKMANDYFIYDNAYSVIVWAPGADQATLLHIPSYAIGVRGANRLVPDGYRIQYADGSGQVVPPEAMIHWRGVNAVDPRVGWSKLEQLRNILIGEATLEAANIEFNRAGRIKAGIIKRATEEQGTPEWSPEARNRFEEDWAARMKGAYGGKSPVLEDNMDWVDAGINPKEAEIIASSVLALDTVCNIFGVHPALFHSNVGNTDVNDARNQVFTDVLPAHFERFAEALDLKLLHNTFNVYEMKYAFDWTSKLQGEEDRIQKLVGAAGRPIFTVNEARKAAGKSPVKGGDELVMMTNVVQVDENGNALNQGKPSTNVHPIPDPNTPAQDGSHREGDPAAAKAFQDLQARIAAALDRGDTETARELAQEFKPLQIQSAKALLSSATGGALEQPMIVSRRAAQRRRKASYATEATVVLTKHFNRQKTSMANGSSTRADAARWNKELASDLRKTMTSQVQLEGDHVAERLMGTFDMGQVTNYISDGAKAMAEGINKTTQKRLDEARAGKKAVMADVLDDVFGNAINARVPSLARGHATKVAGFAATEAGRQNPGGPGTIRIKQWLPQNDSALDRHAALSGESVMISDPFSNGLAFPGDPTASTEQTAGCDCDVDVY